MNWRLWLLIIFLVMAVIAIINFKAIKGKILIKEVIPGSEAAEAGISAGEILKQINGKKINSLAAYTEALSALEFPTVKFNIETENNSFSYESAAIDFEVDEETHLVTEVRSKAKQAGLQLGMKVLSINNLSLTNYSFKDIKQKLEPKVKLTLITDKQEYIFLSPSDPGIRITAVPPTKIKTGLDLQGGSRAIIKPERSLSKGEMKSLRETTELRLSVYGLTDVNVRSVNDLEGNNYLVVEVAGVSPAELRELVGKQGKFEAFIGNSTVFGGGKKDITSVCRDDPSCARIESCSSLNHEAACKFQFKIELSPQAAQRHADITSRLVENVSMPQYLNETLRLYLDDKFIGELFIDVNLKGKPAQAILIEGYGKGATQQEAYEAAQREMKRLQTVLETGSLPFKLQIIRIDQISPKLGKEFTRNMLWAASAAFVAVCTFIYFRYRRPVLFFPVLVTMISEIVLVLFIAVLINWNLDLASIAGIIAAIGTGVDDQIVMIDEAEIGKAYSLKERIKRAFSIIFSAYATTAIAVLPLWWTGVGLLRGFAVTTLFGITVGVFITRPAFAEILKKVTKD